MGLFDHASMFLSLEPPKLPSDLRDLDRATMLLGHMAKGRVKQKVLHEVERLLGELPHPDIVVEWKTALKRHRQELLATSNSSKDE